MRQNKKKEKFLELLDEYESRGFEDFGTWQADSIDSDMYIEHLSKALLTGKSLSQLYPEYYALVDGVVF